MPASTHTWWPCVWYDMHDTEEEEEEGWVEEGEWELLKGILRSSFHLFNSSRAASACRSYEEARFMSPLRSEMSCAWTSRCSTPCRSMIFRYATCFWLDGEEDDDNFVWMIWCLCWCCFWWICLYRWVIFISFKPIVANVVVEEEEEEEEYIAFFCCCFRFYCAGVRCQIEWIPHGVEEGEVRREKRKSDEIWSCLWQKVEFKYKFEKLFQLKTKRKEKQLSLDRYLRIWNTLKILTEFQQEWWQI